MGGFLSQMMGGGASQQKPGFGSTIAAGVVLALVVKAARKFEASRQGAAAEGRSFDPQSQAATSTSGGGQGGLGGILGSLTGGAGAGGLGGMLGGGGLGGLLGGLGGAGALGALINRFQQKGYGDQVGSWVSNGTNQTIEPHEVADALGENAVNELQEKTGMPRESLLAELAHALPEAISQATPQGRAPASDDELHQAARPA